MRVAGEDRMAAPLKKYSVFLSPSNNDFELCAAIIEKFSRTFRIPPFEPHVTVYSGMFADPDELMEAVSAAASGVGSFTLRVRGVDCSEEYFKSLYIDFYENEILRGIHRRIGELVSADSGYKLAPHLSLLYRDMPLSDKRALAQGLHIDRGEIAFDSISISTPGNSVEGWRDTTRWQTVWRHSLKETR